MARLSALIPFAVVASLAACAPSATSRGTAPRTSDEITTAEIAASSTTNAYALIERLRPQWLRKPSVGSIGGGARSQVVTVYLDGHKIGDTESLRMLSVAGIKSMQWLDAARAATILNEVGSDRLAGAILIKTQ